jgi:hypothetical protein
MRRFGHGDRLDRDVAEAPRAQIGSQPFDAHALVDGPARTSALT